ncbi:hypothetical protein [Nocardia brasiliensis]|uniref:hypothetical protein n=1 Tax=Nocardia brasiliensis TaxID=37326 RepID=UPI0024578AE9|nr:hypothetical protein [Nocardia brasiliensis]
MEFRLKFFGFELAVKLPEPNQVSTADIAAIVYSAITQGEQEAAFCMHEHADDDTDD